MRKSGFGVLCGDFFLGVLILVLIVFSGKGFREKSTKNTDMGQSVHNIQEEDIKQAAKIEFETQEKKQVAITFDDGPDPVYTPELLEGLKKRNVRATFFPSGKTGGAVS